MKRPDPPADSDEVLFDPRVPGKVRIIYIIIAMVVVISLVAGIAGYAVWERVF